MFAEIAENTKVSEIANFAQTSKIGMLDCVGEIARNLKLANLRI